VGQRELPPPAHDHPRGDRGLILPSAIADLERAAAQHWQGADRAALGEWLLRAAGGFTGRANSALPLGDPGMPLAAAVDGVAAWYRARHLPAMVAVPRPLRSAGQAVAGPPPAALDDLLAARGWAIRSGPAIVMTAAIAELSRPEAGVTVTMRPTPGPDWLAVYRYRGQPLPGDALKLLLSAPWQAFGTVRRDGQPAAVGRVSVAAGWAGITAVEVAADHRRGGLGTAMTLALARAAAGCGVDRVFLQVEEGNSAARALYERCGFRDAHAYHYRVAPDSGR
jgi:GNAT superfamily N-acetyltransferase